MFRATFWMLHDVVFAWTGSQCCTRACALSPLVARQRPGAYKHLHVALKRAFGQPVQLVARSCVEMLRVFGQAFTRI